ncbi:MULTISPECIES: phospholipase D-like domain-containing protein [Deinococcus]|uniref:Phospholipase D-like domain-containing protein n=1 Tax=Deinococcus rufus TaxID=2136097 RepID=A0ABV7ZGL2_9DEIO|nr:phospholipase D-like domain-containing protein [Deinococcus sp. AB2017081]WQE93625.1 phospholipase D-like domain-containing protein [Deinococcus sp. AB2017081]
MLRSVLLLLLLMAGSVAPGEEPAPALTGPSETGIVRTLEVGALTFLRSPLPPMPALELDGLGSAVPCPPPTAPLDRVLYDSLAGRGAALSCGNSFAGLLSFPQDEAGVSPQPTSALGGFEAVAETIRAARDEVLLATMIWDDGVGSPGALLAGAIADLRRDLQQHPERHPHGVTVRLLLGNSIRMDRLTDPTASAFSAAQHLLAAGVPLGSDDVPGWRLELANYRYTYPHNHMKLLVVDRQEVLAGGNNVSWFHVPARTPGGLGLRDLALRVRGPVARHAVAAFRDAWHASRLLTCPDVSVAGASVRDCALAASTPPVPLLWAGPPPVAGTARVFGLYRRPGEEDADGALVRLLSAATSEIDLLQSQVSGTPACTLSALAPGGCPAPQAMLPVWQAILTAVQERGVRVRMVLDHDPVLQLETLALLGGLRARLAPLGLADHVQARWFGPAEGQHTKMIVVDGQMLVVGSPNLQFASFGPGGMSEYALATSDPDATARARTLFGFEWARAAPVVLPYWLRVTDAPPAPWAAPAP